LGCKADFKSSLQFLGSKADGARLHGWKAEALEIVSRDSLPPSANRQLSGLACGEDPSFRCDTVSPDVVSDTKQSGRLRLNMICVL
jgi:hypothetical protein